MGTWADAGGLWCPECGTEYRPGFAECADCHVPLVTERPAPATEDGNMDHDEPVVYDLSDWSPMLQSKLRLLMRGAAIPVVWAEGATLSVPRAREADMDALIEDVESQPEPQPPGGSGNGGPLPPPPPPTGDGPAAIAGFHRCDQLLCPYGLALTGGDGEDVTASWTLSQADDEVFVTLSDVLAAHAGQVPEIVAQHAATLTDAARRAEQLAARPSGSRPDEDLIAKVTIENLADFAAELSSWCLNGRTSDASDSAWVAATAVMRAVMAMSALTDVVDSAGSG